ncbi:MAG TPA: type II toxin-antitoxin system VapC family toxin [Chthonomonadaceae bacterium]|nr:type II toxin-antitoxin system VapC family toxin [Chthonomonadaceae bacterium]
MYVLDTNLISILERRGTEANLLMARLINIPSTDIYVTVISYEEQIRGWTAAIAATRNASSQVLQYARLLKQLENYCDLSILAFDSNAAIRYEELRREHRRISSPDLKIAPITLVNDATLVTQNERDFRRIVGLKWEDWTR